MLKREILITKDGSKTLHIPEWNEQYHSKHGAVQEALHVFVKNGLHLIFTQNKKEIYILEFGFGTGLNALITLLEKPQDKVIKYMSLEKYPLSGQEAETLDYAEPLEEIYTGQNIAQKYREIHKAAWDEWVEVGQGFFLNKVQGDFKEIELPPAVVDLVYFDAFGKRVQPELWTEDIFGKIYKSLKDKGLMTTYACNGDTKRALKKVGFEVEKKPGPPFKREMINAWKN